VALFVARPVWSPFFDATPGGRLFHKVAASEAVFVLALLWWAVSGEGAFLSDFTDPLSRRRRLTVSSTRSLKTATMGSPVRLLTAPGE
jgi:hypothetical protein